MVKCACRVAMTSFLLPDSRKKQGVVSYNMRGKDVKSCQDQDIVAHAGCCARHRYVMAAGPCSWVRRDRRTTDRRSLARRHPTKLGAADTEGSPTAPARRGRAGVGVHVEPVDCDLGSILLRVVEISAVVPIPRGETLATDRNPGGPSCATTYGINELLPHQLLCHCQS